MEETIHYGAMMHRAMRGLIHDLLRSVESAGKLPGDHHFFITFDTRHPGVDVATWLLDRYPDEMTVVMQHWYDNLVVDDDRFTVTLNFGDQPEPLVIPFDAIVTFVDPSVEFGLRFETEAEGDEDDVPESPMIVIEDDPEDENEPAAAGKEADVVSLDSFRRT